MVKAPERISITSGNPAIKPEIEEKGHVWFSLRTAWTYFQEKEKKTIEAAPLKFGDILNLDFGSGQRSRRIEYKVVAVGDGFTLERVR